MTPPRGQLRGPLHHVIGQEDAAGLAVEGGGPEESVEESLEIRMHARLSERLPPGCTGDHLNGGAACGIPWAP